MKAVPITVVPGETLGPDGLRLSPFARFAGWIKDGEGRRSVDGENSVALLPDGGTLVIDAAGAAVVVGRDGTRQAVPDV